MRQGWTRPQIARGTWNPRDRSVTHARPDVQRRHDRADARIGRDVQPRRTCATTTAGHGHHHHDLPERSYSIQIRTLTGYRLNEKVIGVSPHHAGRWPGTGTCPMSWPRCTPGSGCRTRGTRRGCGRRGPRRDRGRAGRIGFPLSRCLTYDAIAKVSDRTDSIRNHPERCPRRAASPVTDQVDPDDPVADTICRQATVRACP